MKKMALTALAVICSIVCSFTSSAEPSVQVLTRSGRAARYVSDGATVKIVWTNPAPQDLGCVELVLECLKEDGTAPWSYSLTADGRSPWNGSMPLVARVHYSEKTEKFRIRANFYKTVLVDQDPTEVAYSQPFTVYLPKKQERGLGLSVRTSQYLIDGKPVFIFSWQSTNMPPAWKLCLYAEKSPNPAPMGTELAVVANTGGYCFWSGDTAMEPGLYKVYIQPILETGVPTKSSNFVNMFIPALIEPSIYTFEQPPKLFPETGADTPLP